MKKLLTILSLSALLMTTAAYAAPEAQKIAVVDIQKVVAASSQVKTFNAETYTGMAYVTGAINEENITNKDAKKKKSLAESYEKQLKQKREANVKEYTTKLKAADANITAQIGKKATELGYTMVLPKSAVVWGGDDITDTILKVIK